MHSLPSLSLFLWAALLPPLPTQAGDQAAAWTTRTLDVAFRNDEALNRYWGLRKDEPAT